MTLTDLAQLPGRVDELQAQIEALENEKQPPPDAIQESPRITAGGQLVTGPEYLPGVQCGPGYDNGPLIQAAAEASQPRGGKILLPPDCDVYCATPLNFDGMTGVTIEGQGGLSGGAKTATRLIYYGAAGYNAAFSLRSTVGCGFRDLYINYTTNFEEVMHLVDYSHAEPFEGSFDSAYPVIERCALFGNTENLTAKSLLNLDRAISGTFFKVIFQWAKVGVLGVQESAEREEHTYSNAHSFYDCEWNADTLAPILDPGSGWTIICPTVEAQVDGTAQFVVLEPEMPTMRGLTILGGWMGDVKQPANEGNWLDLAGPSEGTAIIGSEIGGGTSVVLLQEGGAAQGLTIKGCDCQVLQHLLSMEALGEQSGWDIQGNGTNGTGSIAWKAGTTMPTSSVIQNPKDRTYMPGMQTLNAGAIGDGSFPAPPPDGTMAYDDTNHKLAIRSGGAWRSVELT